jgi:hypothetical protein
MRKMLTATPILRFDLREIDMGLILSNHGY